METIYVFLATGFEEIEAVATIDTLRRGGLSVKTISVTGEKAVSGAHAIPVIADALFEETDFSNAAMLVLPGGMPGTNNLNAHEPLKKLLVDFKAQDKPIAAICAAPIVLGGLGILDGKNATCYPSFEAQLGNAHFVDAATVVDGKIITGKGPGLAIAFGLAIIEFLKGKEAADEVAGGLLVK